MAGRSWIVSGALLAALAVIAGALGTHFLKDKLKPTETASGSSTAREALAGDPSLAQLHEAMLKSSGTDRLQSYETAVRYQMYHALGMILVGTLIARARSHLLTAAGWAFLIGIVLFSGGIYGWLASGVRPLVHIVPVGGLAWIVGWLLLAVGAARLPTEKP